ncbi:right-handed parallel beta-helix repeat-containing protein [Flammeovirgaceae bacterium SG7u.111]|nr:right-handed parallel beta-helix repeat-containing protein [Flammeovirgaceae bacterium SG7u.132]WPO33870.1 right-handed parallel beta-helix repeat-containing protein [Flammeovirgaceae bacterium SG7u.111]
MKMNCKSIPAKIKFIRQGFSLLMAIALLLFGITSQAQAQKVEVVADGFTLIHSLSELREYASKDNVKVRLEKGAYQIDEATSIRFIQITGDNSHYDLSGVRFMVDTKLFSRTDLAKSEDGNSMYCAIEISGNKVVLEGLYMETYGDKPGRQSKNKMFNLVGSDITLKDVEIRTAGSSPWGYGSLYGLGGGDVRKMNGIRVGYPAKGVKLVGCKVHMRAMGHAIFIQGAENTLIEDCHVDGLLRTTDQILAETSGYCFDKGFYAHKGGYVEGTILPADGKIVPGEIISLSEDGIRMYPEYQGHPTKNTTVKNCTVFQMRRGICTGLSTSGDKVVNCQVRSCVATGFNVGNADTLINCSSDAKYAEAFCIPYVNAKNAYVEMEILDSRGGIANSMLAKINGTGHEVIITTSNPDFIPKEMAIKLSTKEGYGSFRKNVKIHATDIRLDNQTDAKVLLLPGIENPKVESKGEVVKK